MAARKASYRTFAFDGPMLPPACITGCETVHEKTLVPTDASSIGGSESNSTRPSNATAAIKSNPTPSNATSRLGRAVMQSSWIQRLKPFGQASDFEEEPTKSPKKQSHVCTHFAKDFSSCNSRLSKSFHHVRSSSWPLNGLPSCKDSGFPHVKVAEPADSKEQQHKPRVISPILRVENLRVPSENVTHSSDASSRTGNLFSRHKNSKQVSALQALVPCSQTRETSSVEKSYKPCEGETGDGCQLKNFAAQHFEHPFKDSKKVSSTRGVCVSRLMKPSLCPETISKSWKGASARVLGDAKSNGGLFSSESGHRTVDIGGASADLDGRIFLSHDLLGASADADYGIFLSPTLVNDVNPLTSVADFSKSHCVKMQNKKEPSRASFVNLNCETAMPAVVSGSTGKKDRLGQTRVFNREILGNDRDMGSKAGGDLGFLHFGGNSKALSQSSAKPYESNSICNGRPPDRFCISNRNSLTDYTANRKQGIKHMVASVVGSSTVATTARPSTLEQSNPRAFNAFHRRGTNLAASDNLLHFKEELVNNMHYSSSSLDGDVARSCCRETSLEDYWNSWVELFEGPGPLKPGEAGSSTVSLPQKCLPEEYQKYCLKLTANTMKCDATEKLEDFSSPNPHRFVNVDVENPSSFDLPRQTGISSLKNYKILSDLEKSPIQIKQTCWGQEHCASADGTFLEGTKILKKSQEQNLHFYKGATGRVASHVNNQDTKSHPRFPYKGTSDSGMHFTGQSPRFCNDKRTGEAFSAHQAWIQRWQSSAKSRTRSGKALALSPDVNEDLSSDLLVKLPVSCNSSELCSVAPSYKGKSNMGYFGHMLTDSGRENNKHMEALAPHLDSVSGFTPGGSFPARRSNVSLRANHMAPSVEAMAIVGTTASKLHTSSLQNRGSFSPWPYTTAKILKSRGVSERGKGTTEDMLHLVDMDNLEFSEGHIG